MIFILAYVISRGVTIPLSHDTIHITILKTNENAFLFNEEVYTLMH